MRDDACPERRVLMIFHSEFSTGPLDQLRDGRIIDVADAREQVMFDLKVQAAQQPGGYTAAPCKVYGRLYLMDGPGLFHSPAVLARQWKLRRLNAVRKLKDNTQHHAEHERRYRIEQRDDPHAMQHQGNAECQG